MLNINGLDWRIYLVSPFHPALYRSDGSLSIGACDNHKKAIYINENLSSKKLKKVLCHEITHAAIFSYKVDLNIDQEELLADLIATYGQEIIYTTNKIFSRLKEKRESYYEYDSLSFFLLSYVSHCLFTGHFKQLVSIMITT